MASYVPGLIGAGLRPEVGERLPGPLVLAGERLPLVGPLRAWTCGITPYDVTHLGHASVFCWTDLLRSVARTLLGVDTTMVRNVTDVDDVLTRAAADRGAPYDEVAVTHEFRFDRDMRALRVAAPEQGPRARTHVPAVVRLAAALLEVDAAYQRDGHVFFRGGEAVAGSGLDADAALALSREYGDLADDGRESPHDVPVWRPSNDDQPAWPSPWGWGRPGWHAECAAMAMVTLGGSVDVLVGGADLAFPHHAHQQAMVAAAAGSPRFARSVVHVGTVSHRGAKMAKSTGNLVLVSDLLTEHPAAALRLALLDRRWAQPWEYDDAVVPAAAARLDRLYAAAGRPTQGSGVAAVVEALLADLDVPTALDVAEESGGDAARLALDLLKLDTSVTS